jgi:hypothetical protein
MADTFPSTTSRVVRNDTPRSRAARFNSRGSKSVIQFILTSDGKIKQLSCQTNNSEYGTLWDQYRYSRVLGLTGKRQTSALVATSMSPTRN